MSSWIDVGPRAQLRPGQMREAEAGPVAVLLYDLDGTLHATAAICPHHAAWLSQGQINGHSIDCPRHMGRFDIATGRQLRGPDCPDLRTYPARVTNGRIEIQVA